MPQPDNTNEQSKLTEEEIKIREGARVKPGDSNIGNAESKKMHPGADTKTDTTGIEEEGSIKNSK